MKILVTGGAGFIGSHLCEALVANGNSIVALDDLSTGNFDNLISLKGNPKFKFVDGSILDKSLIKNLVEEVDGVMHYAAAVGVEKIINDPIGSLRTNIEGSEIVLTTASNFNKPTILASTSEIYGKNTEVPLHENSLRILGSPLTTRWTYSEAKAIDESLASALYQRNSWNVKIVRHFNTVGPRQSPSYGMVIPRFVQAALENKPLTVYGDGTQRRVFCHIDDAISGILALWHTERGQGEVFNIGGFEEISIKALAQKIIERSSSESKIEFKPYSDLGSGFEDIPRRVPGTSKINKFTNWQAKNRLNQIIDDMLTQLG